jgi:tol-pal system protein YbgF
MTSSRLLRAACLIGLIAFSAPVHAQSYSNDEMADRMDRLEHDLQVLQRQVSRSQASYDSGASSSYSGGDVSSSEAGSLLVRISQLEENLRQMQGQIETIQHQNDALKDQLDRQYKDTDYRLRTLENARAAMPGAPGVAPAPGMPAAAAPSPDAKAEGSPFSAIESPPAAAPAAPATPREQYNAAFRLLNQAQYEQAGDAFEAFVKKNPHDPLVSNAYYWLGETYYVRGNYTRAADYFRQGFESNTKGPKAPDNLLKLALSLSAMQRSKESCVVLKQIGVKYPASAAAKKAQDEASRMNCAS